MKSSKFLYGRHNLNLFFIKVMKIISVQMSFKIHFRCGNPSLGSGVIAVPSGPKSYTFTRAIMALV